MSYITLILKYLPEVLGIFKKIKAMAADGLNEEEIKNALNKIDQALDEPVDAIAESKLNEQWVSDVEERDVPPPLPDSESTKSES